MRYRAFADEVRRLGMTVPDCGARIVFRFKMPDSWSEKKKFLMDNKPHQIRPDVDNCAKAVFDSLFKDDSHIYDIRITKLWARDSSIQIISSVYKNTFSLINNINA